MAQRFSPETIEAIWALLCEGIGPAEIKRRLARDDAGLGYPVDMAKRTLAGHVAKLKADRGEPSAAIKPGEEVDVAKAIRRAGIELQRKRMNDLKLKAATGAFTAKDQRELDILIRSTEELERRAEQPESVKSRAAKTRQTQRETGTSTLLSSLGREIKRDKAQQAEQREPISA